jgi:hypothetical protein
MKVFIPTPAPEHAVRIQFGQSKGSESVRLLETTVEDVYQVLLHVLENTNYGRSVFDKPKSLGIAIYNERRGQPDKAKGTTRYKTIYGLSPAQAKGLFLENFERYLPSD